MFKTIFARFGNIKAGKFVDDETGEDLNDVAKVLSQFNIQLYDAQGNMADVGKILDKLASQWENLETVEKNALASAIAGTRQRENFIVLMDNYQTAIEYTNQALESSGTAMEKYEAYLQGIEASQAKLKATFEEFSQLLVDKGIIKGFYDLATGGVEVLNMVVRLIPVLQILAVLLIGKLSGTFFANLTMNIYKLTLKLKQSRTMFVQSIVNIKAYITSLKSTGTQLMTTAQAAQVAAGKLALMQAAMTVVTAAITITISLYQKHQQQIEENIETAKEHIKTLQEEQKTLTDLKQQYIDLSKSENYNDETRKSIQSVQEQINKLVGKEAEGLDLVNGKLDEQLQKLDVIEFKKAKENLKVLEGELTTLKQNLDRDFFSLGDRLNLGFYQGELVVLQKAVQEFAGTAQDLHDKFPKAMAIVYEDTFGDTKGTRLTLKEAQQALKEMKEVRDNIDFERNNKAWNVANDIVKELTQRIDDYNKALNEYSKTQAQAVVGQYLFNHTISNKEELQAYIDTLRNGEYSEEALAAMTDILIAKFPEFASELGLVASEEDNVANSANAAAAKISELKKELESLNSIYETLNSAIEEYNSNGSISYDTWEKLIDLEDKYLSVLVDENGQIKSNNQALKDLIKTKIEEVTLIRIETYVDNLLTAAQNGTLEKTLALTSKIEDETDARLTNVMAIIASNSALMANKEVILKTIEAMLKLSSSVNLSGDSTSKAQKATEDWEKVLDYANKLLEDKIENLEKEREAIEKNIEEQIKAKEKEIELLEAEKEALQDKNEEKNKEIELEELQRNLQKAQQRTMRVYYEDKGWVWEQDPEALQKAQQELDDFYAEQEIDNIDKKIEALEKEVEALEKTTDEEEDSYDTRLKMLDEQIKKAEEYKGKWNEVKEDYELQQNAIVAAQRLGADTEKGILNSREETLNTFKTNYTAALEQVAIQTEKSASRVNTAYASLDFDKYAAMLSLQNAGSIENSKMVALAGASEGKKPRKYIGKYTNMEYVYDTASKKYYLSSAVQTQEINGKTVNVVQAGSNYFDNAYASGTKSAKFGLANVDEKGRELIVPKQGRYRMMEYGDTVVPHNFSQRLFEVASNPLRFVANALNSVKTPILSNNSNQTSSSIINIGTIELPSVTNGDNFIKQLQIIAANR